MLDLIQANKKDIKLLTEISTKTFDDDSRQFFNREKGGPPGYNIYEEHEKKINHNIYYKICFNDKTIGGLILTKQTNNHMELTSIFIDPLYQNQGFGQKVIQLVEEMYPNILKWSLDTPSVCVRNHYLYEKLGYIKVNEILLDKATHLKLYFYEKKKI